MNAKIPLLLTICLLASAIPVHSAPLLAQWSTGDRADCMAVGPGGEVYVTINNNHKVVKYSAEGNKLAEWDVDGVIETNGITVGPGSEVYVIINNNHRVVKYSPWGDKLDEWGVDGAIVGIGVAFNGLVYIALSNGMIQVFSA